MSKDLYVKNIDPTAREEDLRKLFALVGRVVYIHLVNDAKTGQFAGCGYVKMATEAEAKEAITTLDGTRLINRVITVTQAQPRPPKEPQGGGARGRSGPGKGPGERRR